MAPSPIKPAPPNAFTQTWTETDVAFLDPTSLPIARLPRGWERKQETKVTARGKQKKVWRRYTTRSREVDATPEDEQDEVHDSRSRAVKKLQRMSPGAMEKSASLKGTQRAFNATRWDRRRSVLPRKKRAPVKESLDVASEEADSSGEEQATEDADISNNSFSEVDVFRTEDATPVLDLIPDEGDRRGTFTFSVSEDQHDFCGHEMADLPVPNDPPSQNSESGVEQDATIAKLFRSPTRDIAPALGNTQSIESVQYPELPPSPKQDDSFENEEPQADLQSRVTGMDENASANFVGGEMITENVLPIQDASTYREEDKETYYEKELEEQRASEELGDVSYPPLPEDISVEEPTEVPAPPAHSEPEMEITVDTAESVIVDGESYMDLDDGDSSAEEEFTEASLQLNIQRELELELKAKQAEARDAPKEQEVSTIEHIPTPEDTGNFTDAECQSMDHTSHAIDEPFSSSIENDDITAGLTLAFSAPSSKEPTPRKLRSPSPPPVEHCADETTMTIALDDDTAILKDFLSRAAASKANKTTTTARRESLQNRRDSDVVRHALASPRKVLEEKDPNSPSKYDNEVTLDLTQTLTLTPDLQAPASPSQAQEDVGDAEDPKASRSRRSSRTRKSRLPAPFSQQPAGPPKIAVRRADGGEPIVLKKSDAQELSLLTRTNTRKNKQGSVAVNVRLLKLANDAAGRSEDSTVEAVQIPGKKYVRWDEQLAYYQEGTDTMANMLADAESLATPDELSLPVPTKKSKPKVQKDNNNSTPKIRRVRGLGTANGTPGKGLLQPGSLLPEAVQEEKDAAQAQSQAQRLPKPKSSKLKKMPVAPTSLASPIHTASAESKLSTLDVAPVGIEPTQSSAATTKERKSRLATPKKVKLPQPGTTAPAEGKENQQRPGIAASTPKKGIPMPSAVVPSGMVVGGETGLPRRRARKL